MSQSNSAETTPAPDVGPPDTYTPLLWAVLTEDQRYEEYIRVRTALAAVHASETTIRDHHEAHQRLNETRVADTAGQPLRERIDKIIALLSWERDEQAHIVKAIGAEKDELRAKAEAAEHRRAAAEYRATRIELDKELLKRAEAAEVQASALQRDLDLARGELAARQEGCPSCGWVGSPNG